MKEVKMGVYTRNEETFNFNFYTDLSVANKLKFVNSVTDIVVSDNHYNSVIRDLVFDFYIVDIMTDVDTSELVASNSFLNDVELFLEETNIVEIVRANVNDGLFYELSKAVDDSIAYLTGIHTNPLSEAVVSLINTIENKINEIDLDSMMDMAQKFANMTEDFSLENAVNAYMNSDFHNKNLKEIEEAKSIRTEIAKGLDKAIKSVNEDNSK